MIQIKKTILTLVALLAVTTGAWADETPLLTIENKDYASFKSGSMTFDDMVTVTFSNEVKNYGSTTGWFSSTGSLLTVAGTNGYTITSCKFYTDAGIAAIGYTVEGESPSVFLSEGYVYTDNSKSVNIGEPGVKKIEVYGTAPSAASSGPDIAWNGATKTGTFTMPGGNVTVSVEYYPQAALTAAPTAINDVPATTDGAIVKAGTVANIGSSETAQGTVLYYVSQTALDDAALQALAADLWTADVPTAQKLTKGEAYVYYYVRGNDSDTDEENFSDGDILSANALTVTIAAEPTYAVTFAEGTDPNEWTADPATGVTKGTEVTVTYSGSKKIIGVKAEKKAAAPASTPLDNTTTAWTAGSYAVPAGGLTYSDAITVSGNVTLTLTDGETLTLNKGISLAEGATLTVEGNGTMNVNGTNDNTSSTVAGSGMMCFKSGTLVATGGNGHVGNDLGQMGMNGGISHGGSAINGSLTLEGGNVTATGGNGGNAGGASSINWATGGNGGSAITGNVIINGGNWTANNGSDGTLLSGGYNNVAGTGGKAVAGTVTDNR